MRNEGSPERQSNHWEAVAKSMLKKKEQQEHHLRALQGQILEKKKTQEIQQEKEKNEEK